MLERTITSTMTRAMRTFPALVLTGPRQSGKTTLLRKEYGRTHQFVSLEDPNVREQARSDPVGFLRQHNAPVILDEIQYAPELFSYIKTRIDDNRQPGQWLFTGSQHFPLMQGVSESLAGRVAVLSLLPFSVGEAVKEPGLGRSIDDILGSLFGDTPPRRLKREIPLDDWFLRGGYPEMRANPGVDRKIWCASYIQTYLERDVRQLLNVGDLLTFERFLRLCAARTAQILNLSDLARDAGVSVPTAKRWLSVLESSGQIFLLQPYHKNFGKRLIKSPKLYVADTALATFLTGFHTREVVLNGPMSGALMETTVVMEWVKAFRHRGELSSLYYWRSRDGLELDLLIERNGKLYPLEVKVSSTVIPGMAAALKKWLMLSGSGKRGVILANIPETISLSPGITASPWSLV